MILIIMAMIMMTEKKGNGKEEIKLGPNLRKWFYFKFILILILKNYELPFLEVICHINFKIIEHTDYKCSGTQKERN